MGGNAEADDEAVALIEKYGCPDLINHPNLADKDNCLHQAC